MLRAGLTVPLALRCASSRVPAVCYNKRFQLDFKYSATGEGRVLPPPMAGSTKAATGGKTLTPNFRTSSMYHHEEDWFGLSFRTLPNVFSR